MLAFAFAKLAAEEVRALPNKAAQRIRDFFILKSKLAGAAGEFFSVEIHLVKHMNKEVAKRGIVLCIVREVTAMLEAAAGK